MGVYVYVHAVNHTHRLKPAPTFLAYPVQGRVTTSRPLLASL
jgi:hypothetical protein